MKRSVFLFFFVCLFCLCSCTDKKIEKVSSSDSLYIKKIENITGDFHMGMDVSSLISLENSGVKYYDFDGKEKDLLQILAQNGIDLIRVRVWNDPYDENRNGYGGGNCDIDTAVEIGKRAKEYGMKLLVDFHYSDFWADPSKQMAPKAWKDLSIEEKASALYDYTKDCLKKLKDNKVDVAMVQLGNETNNGMAGEKVWMNVIFHLMANGSKAVREVYPKALVAMHFANPENGGNYLDLASKLAYYDLDYDVFATSYYPYWHGTLENLTSVLNQISEEYGKKTMIIETSYANSSEDSDHFANTISDQSAVVKNYPYTLQGQVNCLTDIIDTAVNKIENCIGICYWEGAWISVNQPTYEENLKLWETYGSGWASSYAKSYDPDDAGKYYGGTAVDNQAFFEPDGKVKESLKVFELCRKGNLIDLKAEAIEDSYIECDIAGQIVLPEKVNAIFSDNSKSEVNVVWDDFDEQSIRYKGIGETLLHGKAEGLDAYCHLSLIEYNYLNNPSFEEDANKTKIPASWSLHEIKTSDELYVETKKTDSINGENHYHFWSKANDSIEFELEQEVKDLNSGTYRYSIAIMGGDGGDQEIYAYVKIDDEIVEKAALKINGYNNWNKAEIGPFVYEQGKNLKVGIYVKCAGEGSGAWGKIDDAKLNSAEE